MKFGIIGFGNIGTRHAHYIQENPETELVAVCDIDPKAIAQAKLLDAQVYQDYEQMLRDVSIEVVCVCTPNYLHAKHTIAALGHGKHVLCEKPMCMSTAEADEMISAARASDKQILVVKQNRYNQAVAWLHELIAEGKLGDIYTVSVRAYWNRDQSYYEQSAWRGDPVKDGGCIYTQFSHFIDILYFILGDVDVVYGETANDAHPYIETEDSGTFYLRTDQGTRISLQYSTCAYEENIEGSITILAEKGSVQIGGKYLNELVYAKIEGVDTPNLIEEHKPNTYSSGYQGTMSNHDQVIQNVVDAVRGNAKIKTSAEEGKQVVSIIERMYAAADKC